ncbi:FAD-dependent oxidoreductase [bacterium]|nr:FAD-dependent oxidoreductase [bacterium]
MRNTEKEKINIKNEAERCLYCYDAPCIKGCPAHINIPEFIKAIREDNVSRASRLIYEENPLGAVCSEICPVEELCMGNCTMNKMGKAINIPLLQQYATHADYKSESPIFTGKKVAIIGGGPAGLAAAEFFAREGIKVTIYEKEKIPGGVLNKTLPFERLSQGAKDRDFTKILENKFIEIKYNYELPKKPDWKEILKIHDAVVIATGLRSKPIKMIGIGHKNVFFADEFLMMMQKKTPKKLGNHIVVIGGGDVAMDCAVQGFKSANKVSVYYRRSRSEMPASTEERENADNTGVSMNYLSSPNRITRNNSGELFIEFVQNRLEEVKGRRPRPVPIKDSNFKVMCDVIVFAVGLESDKKFFKRLGIEMGNVLPEIGEDYQSSIDNVYLIGDITNGGGTVVEAVNMAKEVVKIILEEF